MTRNVRIELLLYIIVIAFSAAVIVEAAKLPPGTFDPIGSGPMPMYLSIAIIILCVIGILSRMRDLNGVKDDPLERYGPMTFMSLLTLVYVGILMTRAIDYSVLTFVFVTMAIWGFESFDRTKLRAVLIVAAVMGFGGQYIFTNVLYVDLPTWY